MYKNCSAAKDCIFIIFFCRDHCGNSTIDCTLSHLESHLQSESAQERDVERKTKLQAVKCKTYEQYL